MPNRQARQARVARNAIAILPYGPSDSVRDLALAIAATGTTSTRLRREGSTFRGRNGELIVNWGNSTIANGVMDTIRGNATLLNSPDAIRRASMKTDAFRLMHEQGVNTTEFTTDAAVAQQWMDDGALVYARTRLQGHSGEGIVMAHRRPDTIEGVGGAFQVVGELPQAPLYTKGITAQRREFRIHVMNGTVTYVQQKKRENNWRDNVNYSNVVRNYHTGWIYATSGIQPNDAALNGAMAAVGALGLDFGAVDVITRGNDAWVLEVNTAPGLSGTNLETYTTNFLRIHRGEQPIRWTPGANVAEADEVVDAELEVLAQEIANEVAPVAPRFDPQEAAGRVVPEAPAVPAVLRQARPVAQDVGALVDKAFYFATINGERTVVQYEAGIRQFFMIGIDVPMSSEDVGEVVRING